MKHSSSYRLLLALLLTSAHALSGTTVHAEDKSKVSERETLEEKLHRREMTRQHFLFSRAAMSAEHGKIIEQNAPDSKAAAHTRQTPHFNSPSSDDSRRVPSNHTTKEHNSSDNHVFGNLLRRDKDQRNPQTQRQDIATHRNRPTRPTRSRR